MSVGATVRLAGFKIRDRLLFDANERIVPQWRAIRETLDSYETGWRTVEASLTACLDYATTHCPFYKPYTCRPLDAFPVVSKLDLIAHREEVLSPEYRNRKTWTMSTSGSTGLPFSIVHDMAKRNRLLAELKVFGERGGYPSHERMVYYRARHGAHPPTGWSQFWSNVFQPDSNRSDRAVWREFHALQARRSTVAVFGYASTMNFLTTEWKKMGLAPNPRVKLALSSAELLTPDVRARMAAFWPNARVLSRYANCECGVLAQEVDCPDEYEWNWASYFLEVLKFDSNEPAADGEVGRIVVTDLFNRAFPMIRYDTGDVGALCRREGGFPVLRSLSGRLLDVIYATDGHPISPVAIQYSGGIDDIDDILQWQFIQESRTVYRFKYVSDNSAAVEAVFLSNKDRLLAILGRDAEFTIERVESFPATKSRKHRLFLRTWEGPERT